MNFSIIDDDELYIFLIKKTLTKVAPIQFTNVFGNGLDAINFIKENRENQDLLPDVLLLDLNMPIMDGWEFLEAYTKLKPTICKPIAIYICSSSISPDDVIAAENHIEVTDYIVKPLSKEKINQLLKGFNLPDLL
ncbi:response regulator [Arenibacter sp. 6A1]|uniref:response regulator n=1 Tax=Arenibacter sp. 6A1 TaxID=2720391 RepID=UPI001444DAE7|nr:response regulator [Arenibacter sp. 6A1]NKI25600.1 response regulator [Arenibacter sp. 6A1]